MNYYYDYDDDDDVHDGDDNNNTDNNDSDNVNDGDDDGDEGSDNNAMTTTTTTTTTMATTTTTMTTTTTITHNNKNDNNDDATVVNATDKLRNVTTKHLPKAGKMTSPTRRLTTSMATRIAKMQQHVLDQQAAHRPPTPARFTDGSDSTSSVATLDWRQNIGRYTFGQYR